MLKVTGLVSWCSRCGAYAESRAKGLTWVCEGHPHDASAEARRQLLLNGRHPVTRRALVGAPTGMAEVAAKRNGQQQVSPAQLRLAALRLRVLARAANGE